MDSVELGDLFQDVLDDALNYSGPTRIHPMVSDPGNQRMLRKWLDDNDSYMLVDPGTDPLTAECDLRIIDNETLRDHRAALEAAKTAAEPVLLPVLLLLPESRSDVIDVDQGDIADNVFATTVDEIVSVPIRQRELEWRIQSLLRLREQSIAMASRNDELSLFQQAVSSSGYAIYFTDTEGTIAYVNEAFERITGYSEAEAVGETPLLLQSGKMPPEFYSELWETITAGDVWEAEIVNRRKNGELYTSNEMIAPVLKAGEPVAFVAIQSDITERKEREERLARRTHAIEEAPIGITISDPSREDNPLMYVNEAFVELTGYSREEVIGGNCRFLQGEATDPEKVASIRKAIDAQEPISIELRNYRKDGTEFWNHLEIAPVEDETGEVTNYIGFQQDVTERKLQERELERQADLFEKTQDIADVGAWEYHLETGKTIFSEWPRDLQGLSDDESPSPEASIQQYHPDDRPAIREAFDRAVEAGKPWDLVLRFHDPDGNLLWVRTRGEAQTEDGERVRIRGTIQDVTSTKHRQRQLDTLDRTLRHNLRNDMNVVRGQAELIKYDTATDVESAADKIIEVSERIVATAEKERAITESLSARTSLEDVTLTPLVRRVTDMLQADYPDAEISVDGRDDITATVSTKFEQVLVELITNAIVHSESTSPVVDISITTSASTVRLEIADEAPPIPEMERKLLEEQQPQTSLYHGSGLGLWLVAVIVTQSNGSITVDDNDPRGNVVRIELTRPDDTPAR